MGTLRLGSSAVVSRKQTDDKTNRYDPPPPSRSPQKQAQGDRLLVYARGGSILRMPYRYLPIFQKTESRSNTEEASNCQWCLWRGWRPFRFADCIRRCLHPAQTFSLPPNTGATYRIGLCRSWNNQGNCQRYTPNLKTRILRLMQHASPDGALGEKVSDCNACRFRGPKHPEGRLCLHPFQRHGSPKWSHWIMGLCHEWNENQSCDCYEPRDMSRRPVMKGDTVEYL
jgi:hypothetical protein